MHDIRLALIRESSMQNFVKLNQMGLGQRSVVSPHCAQAQQPQGIEPAPLVRIGQL